MQIEFRHRSGQKAEINMRPPGLQVGHKRVQMICKTDWAREVENN